MTLPTVSTPVTQYGNANLSLTLTGFTVSASNLLLLVNIVHEGTFPQRPTGVTFGGVALTEVVYADLPSGSQSYNGWWALLNPAVSTANIVVTASANTEMSVEAMLVTGADPASLAAAIPVTAAASNATGGTLSQATFNPTVANSLILDSSQVNTAALTLSANNSQTTVASAAPSGGTSYSYKIGKLDSGATGSRTQGYTASGSYGRHAYAAVVVAPASASPTLNDLTLGSGTSNAVPGEAWSATITGKTSGSTVTALFDDGTSQATTSATLTLSSGFATAGLKTLVSLTEVLAGATNTPHVSTPTFSSRILIQVKIAVCGSSTAQFMLDNQFATTEVPNARIRLWNGSAWVAFTSIVSANKAPGGVGFGNYMLAKLGANYRVDLIPDGQGGSVLSDWATNNFPAGQKYDELVADIIAVGGVDCFVAIMGSNDAWSGNIPSRSGHEAYWRQFISNVRTATSLPNLKFFLAGFQHNAQTLPGTDDDVARGHGGEMNVAEDTNNYLAATSVDLPLYTDDKHLSEGHSGGNAVLWRRVAQAMCTVLFGDTQRYLGPKPGAISYNSVTGWATIAFTLQSGCELVGLTSQSALTGFDFTHSGGAATIVTQPFVSGSAQVAVQLATGLTSVAYTYQEVSKNPDLSNGLWDNGPGVPEP